MNAKQVRERNRYWRAILGNANAMVSIQRSKTPPFTLPEDMVQGILAHVCLLIPSVGVPCIRHTLYALRCLLLDERLVLDRHAAQLIVQLCHMHYEYTGNNTAYVSMAFQQARALLQSLGEPVQMR